MTYKLVMALDPGGTTGVAVRMHDGTIITAPCTKPEQVYELIVGSKLEHVVVERFAAVTISKYGLHTVRIVGGVYALCWEHKIPYTEHAPQHRYPFKKEARAILKGRRVVIHEIEALEHLLRWEHDNGIK
jgi:hypothetical protein